MNRRQLAEIALWYQERGLEGLVLPRPQPPQSLVSQSTIVETLQRQGWVARGFATGARRVLVVWDYVAGTQALPPAEWQLCQRIWQATTLKCWEDFCFLAAATDVSLQLQGEWAAPGVAAARVAQVARCAQVELVAVFSHLDLAPVGLEAKLLVSSHFSELLHDVTRKRELWLQLKAQGWIAPSREVSG